MPFATPQPDPGDIPSNADDRKRSVVIDICHPAHVHFFRHPIGLLQADGWSVTITSRRKEMATEILDEFGIQHYTLSGTRGITGLAGELIHRDLALARLLRRLRPGVVTAIGGIFAAHAGWLTRTPSIVFYDTENARAQNLLTYPLATLVVVPRAYEGWLPARHRRYGGYHELSYLDPSRFTPDREVAVQNGLSPDSPTFLVRTVAWQANHDFGERGWPPELLRHVVEYLERQGKVLISSEGALPPDLESRRYSGRSSAIHHVMAFSRILVGESATMASECAVLGVPAIYAATTARGYTNEQEEKFGLVYNVSRPTWTNVRYAIDHCLAVSLTQRREQRRQLLTASIDVAQFVADTIASSPR